MYFKIKKHQKTVRLIFPGALYVQDDTSGDYKRTLLNLCGGDDE